MALSTAPWPHEDETQGPRQECVKDILQGALGTPPKRVLSCLVWSTLSITPYSPQPRPLTLTCFILLSSAPNVCLVPDSDQRTT